MKNEKNFKVKCVELLHTGPNFTVGKTYRVIDCCICDDNGSKFMPAGCKNAVEWLKPYVTFEVIEDIEKKHNENEELFCDLCGRKIEDEDYIEFDGKIVCSDCEIDEIITCDDCGQMLWNDDSYYCEDNDHHVCEDCWYENYVECENCGAIVHIDSAYGTREGHICDYCYDNYYVVCYDCDELIHRDDAYYDDNDYAYCRGCYEEHIHIEESEIIHSYNYKPDPIFHSNIEFDMNALYMGVELEIDGGGEDKDNAEELLNIANADSTHIYCKHDGSINDGFEIVSHPATLEYHTKNIAWQKVMEKALSMEYRSHDTYTCGLHIHVSRNALGDTYEAQEETTAKIIYFVENHWDNIINFTRRTIETIDRWASRYGIEINAEETYKKAKNQSYNRYRCINLQNDNTIEFRIFRGTLKHSTFLATLQFVHEICVKCIENDLETIEKLSWADFVNDIDGEAKPELLEYLKIRDLM